MSNSPGLVVAVTIGALLSFWGITHLLNLDMLGFGKKKAMREFPEEAKKLGFRLKTSRHGQFGVYSGKYNGYFFTIDPDSNATIHLSMPTIPGLRLSTIYNKTDFETGSPGFDQLFSERSAPPEIREKLCGAKKLLAFADTFGTRWKKKCRFIKVVQDGIYCSFKYGSSSYIPAPVLEKIVPDLVELANLIQAAAKSK